MYKSLGSDRGITVTNQNINETSTVQKHKLGERLVRDERVFRYVYCATEALTAGRGAMTKSTDKHSQVAGATVVCDTGVRSITITPDANLAANELAGGYLCYKSTRFYSHKIVSHPAIASGVDGVIEIETPITDYNITVDVTTLICYPSIWKTRGIIAGQDSAKFVGVPLCSVAVGSYAWVQTWGPKSCAPVDFYGAGANECGVHFNQDGTICIASEAQAAKFQYAGFLLPDTYTVNTADTDLGDGGHLVMLQIAP
jgi:hypothetical protein